MNCQNLNQNIRLEEILHSLGHLPIKQSEKEAWFLNPFGTETQASFKLCKNRNVWYLFSEGIGGKTIDFIIRYFNCSVSEALNWAEERNFNFSFQKQPQISKTPTTKVNEIKPLSNIYLKKYLKSRGLSQISFPYLKEVKFTINQKKLYAIGFENESQGFELRNSFYKGCTSKDISIIRKSQTSVCVFEGFIDALSYVELNPNFEESLLILNSVSMLKKGISELEKFTEIRLFLDNDSAGLKTKNEIIFSFPKAEDCSEFYSKFNDLNDFLVDKQNVK